MLSRHFNIPQFLKVHANIGVGFLPFSVKSVSKKLAEVPHKHCRLFTVQEFPEFLCAQLF